MQNSQELPNSVVGVVSAFAFSALALFGVAYNYSKQLTSVTLPKSGVNPLSSAKRRYGEYMSETSDDIEVICKTLGENSRELSVHDEKISIFCTKANHSKMSIKGITHFQKEDHINSKPRSSRYCKLLSVFRELAATYPKAEFEDWETVEERRKITIVMVEEAHTNFEAHHMKLLDVAVELMTEAGITVQKARDIVKRLDLANSESTNYAL